MAFGVQIKTLKTKGAYTLEELCNIIKDKNLTAGVPTYTKHGFGYVIAFPPIDRQNQVWIMGSGLKIGKPVSKFSIQLQHEIAGDYGNMIRNELLDGITDGLAGMGSVFGKNAKAGEAAVKSVLAEIEALGL